MTNPTRQEIIDAHNALYSLTNATVTQAKNKYQAERMFKYSDYILKVLPPIPSRTMGEVAWDDEKHYLAEAEHPERGKVTMVFKSMNDGGIYYLKWDADYGDTGRYVTGFAIPDKLTPTGRRYVLQEEE